MRRLIAATGACAVLTPLLLVGASSAGASASGSLTVSVTGRDGGTSAAALHDSELVAVNRTTGESYALTPGRAKTLPDGNYAVSAGILTAADQSLTLAGKTVTVSGATKLSFDARAGKPVHLAFSPAAPGGSADSTTQFATVCVAGTEQSVWHRPPGSIYAVPNSSSVFRMGYGLFSSPTNPDGDGAYYLAGGDREGIPAGLTAAYRTSSLASVDVSSRGGLESDTRPYVDVSSGSDDGCYWSATYQEFQATLPAHFTLHLPAGTWSLEESGSESVSGGPDAFAAGHSYNLTFNHAVWGPDGTLPFTRSGGHRLYLSDNRMFDDPTFVYGGALANTAWKLSAGSRTLYQGTVSDFPDTYPAPVIPSAGWYTLSGVARRQNTLPAGMLSTTSTLTLHFYADPATGDQVRDYVTRFWPYGLDDENRAFPGSTTSVGLGMRRDSTGDPSVRQLSDSVKSVKLWYSADDGATWHAATVKRSGGTWTGAVHNPRFGRVALRSAVTDTHGDSSTTTVYNAYGIG